MVTTDLDTQLRRIDVLYAPGGTRAEEYAREREEVRQFLTPPLA